MVCIYGCLLLEQKRDLFITIILWQLFLPFQVWRDVEYHIWEHKIENGYLRICGKDETQPSEETKIAQVC